MSPLDETWDGASDPLKALTEGHTGPFEAFVGAETPRFLAFFQRLGARRSEAEDLTQDTFLKLFRLAQSAAVGPDGHPDGPVQGSGYTSEGRFLGYAFRVARNAWIDRTRRRWTSAVGPSDPSGRDGDLPRDAALEAAPGAEPGPEEAAAQLEEAGRVRAALGALPESHRVVFELGVMQELPYAVIAESLEIPVGTVKSRMHTAVRRVRDALTRETDIEDAIRARGRES